MITLCTIILPRLEIFFLKEWIEHNLSLGVNHINIYNNGEKPVASHNAEWTKKEWWKNMKRDEQEGKFRKVSSDDLVWDKKPFLNYYDDIPYSEIEAMLDSLSDSYEEVSIIPWIYGSDHKYGYPESQEQMLCLELHNNQGWLLNLDPDEFLQLPRYNDLHDLIYHNASYNHFYFGQFKGEMRTRGTSIDELKVFKNFELKKARKWLCNLDQCKDFDEEWNYKVHSLKFKNPVPRDFSKNDAYFIHYRKQKS